MANLLAAYPEHPVHPTVLAAGEPGGDKGQMSQQRGPALQPPKEEMDVEQGLEKLSLALLVAMVTPHHPSPLLFLLAHSELPWKPSPACLALPEFIIYFHKREVPGAGRNGAARARSSLTAGSADAPSCKT